jgi:hypothetical protein
MSHRVHPTVLIAASLLTARALATPETLVDPTRPASATTPSVALTETSGVHVQAVFIRPGSSVAIVNGKLVRAGDHIAGISIDAVTAAGVGYTQSGHPGFATVPTTTLPVRALAPPHKKDVP